MKANDKAQAAQTEANHLFLENYGYKHRKRIKVSPEDEEKAAKHYRELAEKEQGPKTRVRRMDFTKKKKLYWLWQNRIPFGALTTIAGDPDEGKSLITLYLSACVSTGKKLYGNTEKTEPGDVLLLSAEDDPEITLRPRLEAAGAYLDKIHLLESVMLTDGAGKEDGERIAQLDTDIKAIERILDENPDIKLIIIDPISSFLGSANMNREQEVRRVLQPLRSLELRLAAGRSGGGGSHRPSDGQSEELGGERLERQEWREGLHRDAASTGGRLLLRDRDQPGITRDHLLGLHPGAAFDELHLPRRSGGVGHEAGHRSGLGGQGHD